METEGLGRLRINVRDDLKRTWARETRLDRQEKRPRGHDAAADRAACAGAALVGTNAMAYEALSSRKRS